LFNKPLIRSGQSVADEAQKEKIYKVLTDDKHLPSDEMLALDLLTAYVRSARVKGADGRVMSLEKEMLEQIEKARADRIPQVGGWATYQAAMLAPPGEGLKLAEELTRSPLWEVRTLASLAVGAFVDTPSGKEEAKRVAATLSADEDATIQELAKAQVKFLGGPAKVRKQFLPTTQPSAEPTPETQPSDDSGTAGVPVGAAR
jgi:hypothetical protein